MAHDRTRFSIRKSSRLSHKTLSKMADQDAMQADTSVEQEQATAADSTVSAASNSVPSLSPFAHSKWIRSAERRLITASATSNVPDDAELQNLLSAFESTETNLLLTAHRWRVFGALSLWDLVNRESANATDGLTLLQDPSKLDACLALHERATRSSNGSTLELSAHLSYFFLLLRLHYDYEEIAIDSRPTQFWQDSDQEESQWTLIGSQDILKEWTGLDNGPRFLKLHHAPTKYNLIVGYDWTPETALLRIPTRVQARQAGTEGAWDAFLGRDAVRDRLHGTAVRFNGEGNWSHLVWDQLRDFELLHLQRQKTNESIEAVKRLFMNRLCVPHRQHESTAQSFSTFLSTFCPPQAYESTMVELQQGYSKAKAAWSATEVHEDKILGLLHTVDEEAAQYLIWQEYFIAAPSVNKANIEATAALYERAVAFFGLPRTMPIHEEQSPPDEKLETAAKKQKLKVKKDERAAQGLQERESQREAQVRREALWLEYISFLGTSKAHPTQLFDVMERAVGMIPSSGRIWAMCMHQSARLGQPAEETAAIFTRAIEGGECSADDDSRFSDQSESRHQIVELLLARIDVERHAVGLALANEQGIQLADALIGLPRDPDRSLEVYAMIQYALDEHSEACGRDHSLRLQTLASSWVEDGIEGMSSLAVPVWDKVVQQQPTNYRAWLEAAAFYLRQKDKLGPAQQSIKKARSLYNGGSSRAGISATDRCTLLTQWRAFENIYGTSEAVMKVETKIRSEQAKAQVAWQRQQQEYAAWYTSMTASSAAQPEAPTKTEGGTQDVEMNLDDAQDAAGPSSSPQGQKRKDRGGKHADSSRTPARPASPTGPPPHAEGSKKGRRNDTAQPARDRENSSIMVSGLPEDGTRADLEQLFADCGPVREIDGPNVTPHRGSNVRTSAGVVEFMDRTSISAARTKDKTQVRGHEVQVSLGWECTLYVTNFPADTDDFFIRNMFGRYGTIYDVRWPNKKFDSSRRFCYVQYTTSKAATDAQGALHEYAFDGASGSLQVHLSDPSRKKQRTDANANEREIYVTGIPRSATEEQVKTVFVEATGAEAMVRFEMPLRPNGKPQGIAFADFKTPLDAQKAVTMLDGSLLNGATLKVQISRSKKKN